MINKGSCFKGLKQYNEALDEFDNALRIKKECSNAYYNKGLIYNLLKTEENYNAAIQQFDLAIKYKADFSLAYYEKGISQMGLGNYALAIDSFNKCKEIDKEETEKCDEKIYECNEFVNK